LEVSKLRLAIELAGARTMQTDLSVEIAKVVLIILMFMVGGAAIFLIRTLNGLIRPISRQLIELHKGDTAMLETRLQKIEHRYIALNEHVDNIDAAEFRPLES
jgi:ABC-type proline/glycine betaine transport system ATPase subunit